MNPKDFDWKEDQQVIVKNPTDVDYKFKVHSKDYMVKAGQTAKMPGYIAWVYASGLATKMAQETNVVEDKDGKKTSDWQHWNEEGFRQQYYDKIVVRAEATVQEVVAEPESEVETFEEPVEQEEAEETATSSTVQPMRRTRGRAR